MKKTITALQYILHMTLRSAIVALPCALIFNFFSHNWAHQNQVDLELEWQWIFTAVAFVAITTSLVLACTKIPFFKVDMGDEIGMPLLLGVCIGITMAIVNNVASIAVRDYAFLATVVILATMAASIRATGISTIFAIVFVMTLTLFEHIPLANINDAVVLLGTMMLVVIIGRIVRFSTIWLFIKDHGYLKEEK